MGEHPATILQPNVTKLGGIRTHEARRAGTRKAERPNKQGLLGIRTNRGGWLQANYKTAALPLSYAGKLIDISRFLERNVLRTAPGYYHFATECPSTACLWQPAMPRQHGRRHLPAFPAGRGCKGPG